MYSLLKSVASVSQILCFLWIVFIVILFSIGHNKRSLAYASPLLQGHKHIDNSYTSIGKIGFGSCNEVGSQGSLWNVIGQQSLDKLILLGDNVYADTEDLMGHKEGTPDDIRLQYERLFSGNDWRGMVKGLGGMDNVLAVYDDHDFGVDNSDRTYQYRNQSRDLFNDYFRSSQRDIRREDGIYNSYLFPIGNLHVKVILLDTRYNKSPSQDLNGDFLGETQWRWLQVELQDVFADLILLGSSIQVLSNDKLFEENWGRFPSARERLLGLVLATPTKVLLLSGDVHYAEFSDVTCTIFEKESRMENSTSKRFLPPVSYKRDLTDFTSSGLTHTFTHDIGGQTTMHENNKPISRGIFIDMIYKTYQATFPSRFRRNRHLDHYHGLNFGLLNILQNANGEYVIEMAILNHRGETVMQRLTQLHIDTTFYHSDFVFECEAIRGDVPQWRWLLFITVLVLLASVIIVGSVSFMCILISLIVDTMKSPMMLRQKTSSDYLSSSMCECNVM